MNILVESLVLFVAGSLLAVMYLFALRFLWTYGKVNGWFAAFSVAMLVRLPLTILAASFGVLLFMLACRLV